MAEPALSPALADALHELEVALLHVFASKCLAIAGFCILCYDHSLTFYEEAIEHSRKKINTPVLYVLYRDGIVYFLVICCCSIFNMMVWLLAPPTLVALSKYFVLAIIPTMGSRLVLNLRSSRREDIMPTDRTTADETAYEMHPSKGLLHKSSGDRLGTFSPNAGSGQRCLSAQERDHLPRAPSTTNPMRGNPGGM
ncbi:putative transmembrane protein [Rhizoctonia solani 123E]|uniref:Putative transmembrane protein n=1 Tax=Rhizoctonia solani 123E TaxID=1423351 RepID=A0A074RIN8_9AGAM|nr:putative transmembrane protein [Rhizoctonia solani 123E]